MPKPDKPPGQGGGPGGGGPPGQATKPLSAVATLHEAADTAAIAGSIVTTAALPISEAGDSAVIAGKVTAKAVLPISEAGDSAQILGTVAFVTRGTIAASENRDICAGTLYTPQQATSGNFVVRRSSPGVVRWHKFNAGSTYAEFDSTPITSGTTIPGAPSIGPDYNSGTFADHSYGWQTPVSPANLAQQPVLDTSVPSSGSASMRIDIVQGSDAAQGLFIWHFFPASITDPTVGFGAGDIFYLQWRARFNANYANTAILDGAGDPQAGQKHVTNTTGAGYGMHDDSAMQLVTTDWYQHKFLTAMGDDPSAGQVSAGFWDLDSTGTQDWLQDAIQFCTRRYTLDHNIVAPASAPACFALYPDEWLTFMLRVDLSASTRQGPLPSGRYYWANSKFSLWGARNNGAQTLLINWNPAVNGYRPLDAGEVAQPGVKFGKAWFNPQCTGKSTTQSHPTLSVYFDELIVGTQAIPFPPVYPAWRVGKQVGVPFQLAGTASMGGYLWPLPWSATTANIVDAWNGWARVGSVLYSAGAGGHGDWQNSVLKLDLSADAPAWSFIAGSVSDAAPNYPANMDTSTSATPNRIAAYYGDKRPVSTHEYYSTIGLEAVHARDGIPRVMRFSDRNAFAFGAPIPNPYTFGNYVNGFKLTTNRWDSQDDATPGTFWADCPLTDNVIYAFARDTRNGNVYMCGDYSVARWTASTGTWTANGTVAPGVPLNPIEGTSPTSGGILSWAKYASLVDVNRNRLVCIHDGGPNNYDGGIIRIQYVNLATGAIVQIPLTGSVLPEGDPFASDPGAYLNGVGLCHDLDNDKYLLVQTPRAGGFAHIFRIDPATGATDVWVDGLPPSQGGSGGNGPYNRFEFLPALSCVAYLSRFSDAIYIIPTQ